MQLASMHGVKATSLQQNKNINFRAKKLPQDMSLAELIAACHNPSQEVKEIISELKLEAKIQPIVDALSKKRDFYEKHPDLIGNLVSN